MKTTKKLLAVLLSAAIMLAMGLTTLAASGTNNNNGSITVDNAVVGQTYSVYQVLQLESYDTDSGAYSYKAASTQWAAFLATTTAQAYVSVDTSGYVTWVSGADSAAFAKAAVAYAVANNISATASQVATSTDPNATTTTVAFTNLNLGYYVMDSTMGTLASLTTTDPNATISEKNEVPSNTKHVQEGSVWGSESDAKVGDTIPFKSIIIAKEGAESYVFTDTMSAGLTFNASSLYVTLTTTAAGATETTVAASNYTVSAVTTNADGSSTFTVTFTQTFCDTLLDNYQVIVYYTATLNENAVVGSTGNTNQSSVSYGNNGQYTTTTSETKTYTWDVDVFKYATVNGSQTALAGATFELSYASDANATAIAFVDEGNNVYRVATAAEIAAGGTVTSITTDDTGAFTLEGLDSATYKLTETAAPSGYNKLAGAITIAIESDGTVEVNGTAVSTVEVENSSGTVLPTTGGMGTTIFYILGAVLVVGAGVVLVVRRRMSASK